MTEQHMRVPVPWHGVGQEGVETPVITGYTGGNVKAWGGGRRVG